MSTDPGPSLPRDDRTLRRVLIFFLLILAVLVGVVVVSLRNLNRAIATSDWVNHTHALITELDALQPTLLAAEGDLSKYLLASDPRHLAGYQEKIAELGERVDVITALITGAPEEQKLFAPIAELLTRRAEQAKNAPALKQSGDIAALRQLLTEEGDLRELERRVERLREHEAGLLSARDRASFQQAQTTRWTVLGGLGLDILLLCGAAWLIRDDLAARRQTARLLQQTNEELEEKVRARTAEIAATNAKLLAQNIEDRWAKQAIEHQNRYNLLIIDSVSDSVFVVTKLMNVSRMNPAAVHLTGYEPSGLVDKPLGGILSLNGSSAPAPTYDPLARALAEGHDLRGQPAVVLTKGGQSTPVRLSVFPLRDRDKVVGGVVVLQSIASSS
jgi:PAS domain S-box-containing protein